MTDGAQILLIALSPIFLIVVVLLVLVWPSSGPTERERMLQATLDAMVEAERLRVEQTKRDEQ